MNDNKYKGLVAALTREILGGKFTPLGAFPSERALAARFGVSRQTIRRVMRELNRTGRSAARRRAAAQTASIVRALRRRSRPEAIVCQNDVAAVNALAACRTLRWRVPNDVLLAGFDDVACAPLLEPSLTSVRQPCKHIAGRAFDLLLARIGKDRRPAEDVRMSAELVVRGSTTKGGDVR